MASNAQKTDDIGNGYNNYSYLKNRTMGNKSQITQSDLKRRVEAIENPSPLVLNNHNLRIKDKLNPYNPTPKKQSDTRSNSTSLEGILGGISRRYTE